MAKEEKKENHTVEPGIEHQNAMEHQKQSPPTHHELAHHEPAHHEEGPQRQIQSRESQQSTGRDGGWLASSAALIGIGALIEPELLGGMLLGAGAVYLSRNFGIISGVLRPVLGTVVRVGYAVAMKANEVVAEASEDVQDMIAEARTEYHESSSSEH